MSKLLKIIKLSLIISIITGCAYEPIFLKKSYEKKILRSIDWIERKYDEFVTDKLTIDQISVACALDYTSFRFTDAWGDNNIKLKKWLENITKNDFMKSTLPGESFKYE